MKSFRLRLRLAERLAAAAALCALGMGASGCDVASASTPPGVGVSEQALTGDDLLKQCGLICPGDKDAKNVEVLGIEKGSSAISGVASVDAFFASVIHFQGAATGVAGGIKAQLDAIRGDFGIAADADLKAQLMAQITANIDGELKVDAEPAVCEADVHATLEAQAHCDAEFTPGKLMVACKGGCDMDVSADVKCDADATLECTVTPPNLQCSGMCQGTCKADVTAMVGCTGTCTGTCDGTCSAYSGAGMCAGKCDGKCTGKCEAELAAKAECKGECRGECTLTDPMAGCKGAVHATCRAKANASIMCDGKCDADFEPPMAKAECQASAKAEAKINVQCTPPRIAVSYKLKANVDAKVQAKFEAALKTFASVRLPALVAEIKRGKSVTDAGAGIVTSAGAAVKVFGDRLGDAKLSVKSKFGLGCAVKELPKVEAIITKSTTDLSAQLKAAGDLTSALKVAS